MKLRRSTMLGCSLEQAWQQVQRPALLEYVTHPLLRFRSLEPSGFAPRWQGGDHRVQVLLLGRVSLGEQVNRVVWGSRIPGVLYEFWDDGDGQLASRWRHRSVLERVSEEVSRYTDEVEVRAGLFTPAVGLFAWWLYRHRQNRWRALTRHRFAPLGVAHG